MGRNLAIGRTESETERKRIGDQVESESVRSEMEQFDRRNPKNRPGLPNRARARFPSVPCRLFISPELALSQDRKRDQISPQLACLPHNLPPSTVSHFIIFFSLSLTSRLPRPIQLSLIIPHNMTQSPIPDDPNNSTENSSPSDFHSSVETSPAIGSLPDPPASDGGHSPLSAPTRSSFQHRNSLDIQRSVSSAGRGGCWCVLHS
jgi:hypothetical protein